MSVYIQHKAILDNLHQAVILVNRQLHVLYLNPAAEAMLGYTVKKAINQDFTELVQVDEDFLTLTAQCLKFNTVTSNRAADWSTLGLTERSSIDYTITPFYNDDTALLIEAAPIDHWLKISRAENLKLAHQTGRKIIRGMAHEVKNPLGGIRGAAQLMAKEFQHSNTDAIEFCNIIIEEADRLKNLIDRMLGPNNMPHKKAVNLHELIERVIKIINVNDDKPPLTIERDYDPSMPDIQVDRDQIIQALLNIASNAVTAMDESKTTNPQLTFKTRAIKRHALGQGNATLMASIVIEDNGPGIPKHLADTIFFPMVSGSQSGTGLGLSISQSLIHQHSGSIEYVSHEGATTFTIFLPFAGA